MSPLSRSTTWITAIALVASQLSFAQSPAASVGTIDRILSRYEMTANVDGNEELARAQMMSSLGESELKVQDLVDYAQARLSANQYVEFDRQLKAIERTAVEGKVSFTRADIAPLAAQLFQSAQQTGANVTGTQRSGMARAAVWIIFATAITTATIYFVKKAHCSGGICSEDNAHSSRQREENTIRTEGQKIEQNNVEIGRAKAKLANGETFELIYGSDLRTPSAVRDLKTYVRELEDKNLRLQNSIDNASVRLGRIDSDLARTLKVKEEANAYGWTSLGLGVTFTLMASTGMLSQ